MPDAAVSALEAHELGEFMGQKTGLPPVIRSPPRENIFKPFVQGRHIADNNRNAGLVDSLVPFRAEFGADRSDDNQIRLALYRLIDLSRLNGRIAFRAEGFKPYAERVGDFLHSALVGVLIGVLHGLQADDPLVLCPISP